MDSVGACIRCQRRLCANHAIRGMGIPTNRSAAISVEVGNGRPEFNDALSSVRIPIDFGTREIAKRLAVKLEEMPSDLRPLFRYQEQRQAFNDAFYDMSGVICRDCRLNGGLEAARSAQILPPALLPGGSQQLRDAAVAYQLGDLQAYLEMSSDVLFPDLVRLVLEREAPVRTPVEWEPNWTSWGYRPGKVRATEDLYRVLDITVFRTDYDVNYYEALSPLYMNPHGQWVVASDDRDGKPVFNTEEVVVQKKGWFREEQRVLRVRLSSKPPTIPLDDILRRSAELLAPVVEPGAGGGR